MRKEVVVAYFHMLVFDFRETRNSRNISVNIIGAPAVTRTGYLSNIRSVTVRANLFILSFRISCKIVHWFKCYGGRIWQLMRDDANTQQTKRTCPSLLRPTSQSKSLRKKLIVA